MASGTQAGSGLPQPPGPQTDDHMNAAVMQGEGATSAASQMNAEARAAFARNPENAVEAAERNWPEMQRTLVRN